MSKSLKFDVDEVAKFGDLVVSAAGVAPAEARKVVAKGALDIKNDARRRRSGSQHFPRLPAAITYESHVTATGGWADIGPDHDKPQGNLGHIPEYGSLKTAARPYMRPAAEAELPKFERAMEALAVKALEP